MSWGSVGGSLRPRSQVGASTFWMLFLAIVGSLAAGALIGLGMRSHGAPALLWTPLLVLLVPSAAFGLGVLGHPSDALDARRLAVHGRSPEAAATTTLLLGFVQFTSLVALVPYAALGLALQQRVAAPTAWGLAAIGWVGCVLAHRIGARVGRAIAVRRSTREVGAVFWYLVTLAATMLAFALIFLPWEELADDAATLLAEGIDWVPGANLALAGAVGDHRTIFAVNLALALVAGVVEWWLARRDAQRVLYGRGSGGRVNLGIFAAAPGSATWSIAARTWLAWLRDGRYRLMLITIAILPPLLVLPVWIAGVGAAELVLLPVPIFALLFGWALHNDIAYDSTALWLHVTGGLPGRADRLGRAIPTIVTGVILVVAGSALVLWVTDDTLRASLVAAVSLALLGVGVGGSSIMSAVSPYPVARPGDSPLSQPVSAWGGSFAVHGISLLVEIALCAPAIWLSVLALLSGDWQDALLAIGVALGTGVVACTFGILIGGQVFQSRRTKLLNRATLID